MKSRFKTFILSAIPGLGHIYLGDTSRGIIFFIAIVVMCFSSSFMGYNHEVFNGMHHFFECLIPILWAYQAIDAQITISKVENGKIILDDENEGRFRNNLLIATLLSIIPGVGHFYIGRKNKGEKLFVIFLIAYLISSFINLDIIRLAVPVIMIYSILDLRNEFNANSILSLSEVKDCTTNYENGSLTKLGKILGIIFIVLGIFIIGDKLAPEFFDYASIRKVKEYIGIVISSFLVISIGIKLLLTTTKNKEN
ncbi:hypothetical protein SAMN02745163_00930 [Clostridium cavendishii DSM 21758]|uniref:DUF6677 domain-containing protein n=1 Tax=Clostridium cavendishii DSM 21758 TaxID=1121302 RepID=A0A1M6ESG2_9CLOT|nr:DUF6677 family protein [Clostridium cavendishii]SHI88300.1 hypothetical protein SAMN02745163_00930 [Clostridium cavendishii DSM 21758]